jgi:hypothetical protein
MGYEYFILSLTFLFESKCSFHNHNYTTYIIPKVLGQKDVGTVSLYVNNGKCALVCSVVMITNLLIRALKRTFILF